MTKVLITICARAGSKGVLNKNIRKVNDKPLIAYSIAHAKKLSKLLNADLILSTDGLHIIEVAEAFGLSNHGYLRPEHLANDSAGKIDVLFDVKDFAEQKLNTHYDFLIDLDVSSPIRKIEEVLEAYEILKENPDALNIFSVSPAHKNPYFNMVETKGDGFVELSKKLSTQVKSRQAAKEVFELNASFYIYTDKFFKTGQKGAITEKSLMFSMPDICFDIDNEIDLEFFEFLLKTNKLNMTL